MKKAYVSPSVEVVKFDYSDQVVVASGNNCKQQYTDVGDYVTKECVNKDTGWNHDN